MNQDQQRAAFEAWCKERFGQIPLWAEEDGEYILSSVRLRFEAYQAALASPEVVALRKDAERLDWVAKNARCDPDMSGNHHWWPTSYGQQIRGNTFRAAIDAAMEKQK